MLSSEKNIKVVVFEVLLQNGLFLYFFYDHEPYIEA